MYWFMALAVVLAVVADQLVKLWVVQSIPLHTVVEAIPGLFHFTYVQNTGAAFSALEGQTWLFALVFLVFSLALVWEFSRKRWGFTTFERWCIVAVFAGGLGNMIDRIRLGYVVDMIAVDFMDFPVFNVADCYITVGCIVLMVSLVFFNKKFWKEEQQ
ncbi:MAG: signal peptidase II [Oscillospiraceae bacterium]|nr:signal peptidase II [Oscillospiraceae bacterium]